MKSRTYLLCFIISILAYHTAFSQEDLKDSKLVTNVFNSLKKQNEKKFLKSLPTKAEIDYLIPMVKTAQPDQNIPEADSIISNFRNKATDDFRKVIQRGSNFGVMWGDIVLQNVSYKDNPDPNVQVERRDITLECSSHDKKFLIILKKSSKILDEWRVMDTMKFTLL
ncbi:hypothetical protein [Formosa agariphila]|nr:hypothetical protein [Formosa agariphila]